MIGGEGLSCALTKRSSIHLNKQCAPVGGNAQAGAFHVQKKKIIRKNLEDC